MSNINTSVEPTPVPDKPVSDSEDDIEERQDAVGDTPISSRRKLIKLPLPKDQIFIVLKGDVWL